MTTAVGVAQGLGDFLNQLLDAKRRGDGEPSAFGSGALTIVALREAHRAVCEDGEALRVATAEAKDQLDQSSLQLQNLLYEKQHYEKEIAACRSFRSEVTEEQLELLPPDEFAAHPAALLVDDPHQLMLNRLNHELAFRQETLQELDPLKARREALAAEVAQRHSALAALEAEVVKLRAAVMKVGQQFEVPMVPAATSDKLAALLPLPLYILYSQLAAAAAASDVPAAVSVGGKAAASMAERLQQGMLRSPSTPAIAAETAAAEGPLDTQQGEDGAFPLCVDVSITPAGSSEPALALTFRFLPDLNLITVAAASADQRAKLDALYEGDSGCTLPAGSSPDLDVAQLPGRPYVWAQRAAGLDVLPSLPDASLPGAAASLPEAAAALQQYSQARTAHAVLEKLAECAGVMLS